MAEAQNANTRRIQRPGKPEMKVVTVRKPSLAPAENTEEVEVPDVDTGVLHFAAKGDEEIANENPFSEKEAVFWVGDTCYESYVRVPASWGLQYLRFGLTQGSDMATMFALEQAMGVPAVQALMELPDLTAAQLDSIVKKITQKFVDATSLPKDE